MTTNYRTGTGRYHNPLVRRRMIGELIEAAEAAYRAGEKSPEVADRLRRTKRGSFSALTTNPEDREELIASVLDDARGALDFDPDYGVKR